MPVKRVLVDLGGDLVEDRLEVLLRRSVSCIRPANARSCLTTSWRRACAGFVVLHHLADVLQRLAADALGRKLASRAAQTSWCWPAALPQLQFLQQLLRRKLHDRAQRRGQLLLQIASVGKRLQQVVESLLRLLVTLALQIEPGDLLVVLDVLRIDLLQQDLLQGVAGNGTGGHPHVPHVA